MVTNKDLEKIIEHYGAYRQISKAVEELIELSEVLIKDINKAEIDKNRLLEEMADVTIMLEQLKIIYNIRLLDMNDEIDRKVERTLKRVEADSEYIGTCESCKYTDKGIDEDPCKDCNHNNGSVNRFEPQGMDGVYYDGKGNLLGIDTDCGWK